MPEDEREPWFDVDSRDWPPDDSPPNALESDGF